MAYGTKYKITFDNYFGKSVELLIKERNYSGSQSYFTGSDNTIVIEWTKKSEKKHEQVVFSSRCIVTIMVTTKTTVFSELFTSDRKKFRGEVYVDSVLYWIGYGANEEFMRTFTKPSPIVITFTDGLGLLQQEDFPEVVTGKHRLSEFVGGALYATGIDRPVYEAINIYEENQDSDEGDSMLYQTYKESADFYGLSWHEVLGRVLKGCRVCQRWGAWWIIRISEMTGDEIIYRKWDSNYDMSAAQAPDSNSSEDLSIDITEGVTAQNVMNVFMNQSNVEIVKRSWKELTLRHYYGYTGGKLSTLDWEDYTVYGNWGSYNVVGNQLILTGSHHGFESAKYLQFSLGQVEISTVQRFKITVRGTAQGIIVFQLYVDSDSGENHYLNNQTDNDGYNPFSTSIKYCISGTYYALQEISFEITSDTFKGAYNDYLLGSIEPFPANVYLRIYKPYRTEYGNVGGMLSLDIDESKIEIISDIDGIEESHDYVTNINDNHCIIPDPINLYIGDSNGCANDTLMYYGILYRKDGATYYPTEVWRRRGSSSSYVYQGLILQDIAYEWSKEWVLCTGVLKSYGFDICKIPVATDGKKYMIAGAKHDLRYEEWNVTMFELRQEIPLITESTESEIIMESTESEIIEE